jgi:hypothetical protein
MMLFSCGSLELLLVSRHFMWSVEAGYVISKYKPPDVITYCQLLLLR